MSTTQSASSADPETGLEDGDIDRDVVLDVLSNERRRYVVHYLKRQNGTPVSDGELAEVVADWESNKSREEINYKDRKRVRNALRQFHLPKMDDMGFVEYDSHDGTVTLSQAADRQEFYVDVLPKRGIPWGLYYLGLSVAVATMLIGSALGLPPFSALPVLAWCLFGSTALFVSSVGHFYDNYYRMRLGAREKPPGVDES